MKKIIGFILSFFVALFLTTTIASANSALRRWEPEYSFGVYLVEDNPIDVTKEDLIFELGKDNNTVSAEYTFYNSSDEAIEAELLFPIGSVKEYFSDYNDWHEYSPEVYINSSKIETELRLVIREYYSNDNPFDSAFSKLEDDYTESIYDSYDYYKCNIDRTGLSPEDYVRIDDTNAEIDNSLYYFYDDYFYFADKGGYQLNIISPNGQEVPFDLEPATKYEFVKSKIQNIYGEKVYELYSEIDLYNAAVKSRYNDVISTFENYAFAVIDYKINIPAKSSITNKVVTDIYEGVDGHYTDPVGALQYYLSPAKTFKSFKNLNITINTHGVYLIENNLGFKKINDSEHTYTKHYDTLPDFEIQLSISTTSSPKKYEHPIASIGRAIAIFIEVFFLALFNIIFIAGTIVPTIIQVSKKIFKKNIYLIIENIAIAIAANVPFIGAIVIFSSSYSDDNSIMYIAAICFIVIAITLRIVGIFTINKKIYNNKTWIFDSIALALELIALFLCITMDRSLIWAFEFVCLIVFGLDIVYMFIRQKFIKYKEESKEDPKE